MLGNNDFTYLEGFAGSGTQKQGAFPAPTVTSIAPNSGQSGGGTAVTIKGAAFLASPTVTIGGQSATSIVRVSLDTITCITPAHAAGATDVVVTNSDTQSGTLTNGYTFTAVFAAQNAARMGNLLSATDPATMRIVSTDSFIIGGWVKWASAGGPASETVLLTKGDSDFNNDSYVLFLDESTGLLTAGVGNGAGIPDIEVTAATAIVSGTKAFVLMWATATTINIKINAGTIATAAAIRTNIADPGGDFCLFDNVTAVYGYHGILDEVFFCKNPSDMPTALSTIASSIYNGGNGTTYSSVSSATKTAMGLISWWGLDEASGATRKDLNGTNDLALTGTITQVSPLV